MHCSYVHMQEGNTLLSYFKGWISQRSFKTQTGRKWSGTDSICLGIPRETTKSLLFHFHFHSIYDTTAPSGPWPPLWWCLRSSLSSARLLHPNIPGICDMSLRTMSSQLVLGFPTGLVLCNFPLRIFWGDLITFHSYNMTRPYWSSNFNIVHDI